MITTGDRTDKPNLIPQVWFRGYENKIIKIVLLWCEKYENGLITIESTFHLTKKKIFYFVSLLIYHIVL